MLTSAENLIIRTVAEKAHGLGYSEMQAHDFAVDALDDYRKGKYKKISDITDRKIPKLKKVKK